tara:strand:+ start:81 stop:182 length:102 start_codon:yes stop_codon:yes gene_type:complete
MDVVQGFVGNAKLESFLDALTNKMHQRYLQKNS